MDRFQSSRSARRCHAPSTLVRFLLPPGVARVTMSVLARWRHTRRRATARCIAAPTRRRRPRARGRFDCARCVHVAVGPAPRARHAPSTALSCRGVRAPRVKQSLPIATTPTPRRDTSEMPSRGHWRRSLSTLTSPTVAWSWVAY